MSTKIDIISGFLGAGKTTLIKKLLNGDLSFGKVVIIENEFGQIGIDGGFLKDTGIQIKEINSGCICCSLVGDFNAALKEVLKKFQPDRIIIEPSGVGKLSDIITACKKAVNQSDSEMNICAAVVDPIKYKIYIKNFSEFFSNQIEYAKTIILSRTQMIAEEKLLEVVKDIKSRNHAANIITTPWDELTAETMISVAEQDISTSLMNQIPVKVKVYKQDSHVHCSCGHAELQHEHKVCSCDEHKHEHCTGEGHHHAADEVFENWGIETPHIFTENEIKDALKILSDSDSFGTVLRAKGIIPIDEKNWVQFDFVPEEFELKPIAPDYTGRLCVIGVNLNDVKLAELFHV
jgi:G3E family GTPase